VYSFHTIVLLLKLLINLLSGLSFLEITWVFTECFKILCCMSGFALHITIFPSKQGLSSLLGDTRVLNNTVTLLSSSSN